MLEFKEELQLVRRWQEHEDPEAVNCLISSHLRLFVKILKGVQGYCLPINELISECNVGRYFVETSPARKAGNITGIK